MINRAGLLLVRMLFFAFIAIAVVIMGYDIRYEDRSPFIALSVLISAPLYLIWLLGTEIRKKKLTAASFYRPIAYLAIFFVGYRLDAAVMAIRSNPTHMNIANDLKQIGLGLFEYQKDHGSLPPAFTRSPEGMPLLSWRVLILPYLEQQNLYSSFHLDEPWDSPHNQTLIPEMPRCYLPDFLATSTPGLTFYLALTGPGAAFDGDKGLSLETDFPDKPRTILIGEARTPVIWTKPEDLAIGSDVVLPEFGAPRHNKFGPIKWGGSLPQVFGAGMADGSSTFLHIGMDASELRALILRTSSEKHTPEWQELISNRPNNVPPTDRMPCVVSRPATRALRCSWQLDSARLEPSPVKVVGRPQTGHEVVGFADRG